LFTFVNWGLIVKKCFFGEVGVLKVYTGCMTVGKDKVRLAVTFPVEEVGIFRQEAKSDGVRYLSDWLLSAAREKVRRNRGEVRWGAPLTEKQ